jgi:hypothetical protein
MVSRLPHPAARDETPQMVACGGDSFQFSPKVENAESWASQCDTSDIVIIQEHVGWEV